MNPELVVTDAHLFILVISCLGSVVVGFLVGFLSARVGIGNRLEELEALAERLSGKP